MKTNRIFRRIGRLTAMGATLAAVACTGSFEEYNTKPYRPSDEDLEGDNVGVGILFPSMMEWMMHVQVNASQYHDVLLGDELGGYASAVKSYQGQNIATYNPSDDFNDPLFENTFSNFYGNYFQIMTETGGEGPVYELSRIIRVASMLRVTDAYGPIPYSKMQNGTFSVPYDSQRDVYMAMIDDLDEAMESLHTFAAAGGGSLLSDFDISTYKGDVSLWIQFANTLKLRMAIRMSGVEPEAQRIAEEAAKQSGRGIIPQVRYEADFVAVLNDALHTDLPLFMYETGERETIRDAIEHTASPIASAAIITGPEGGFAEFEADMARKLGMHICSMGERILRCETAPVVALTALMYGTGNL